MPVGSKVPLRDAWLTERIKQVHAGSRGVYGAPRIHAEVRLEHDIRVGQKRVAWLMKTDGIAGVRLRERYRTTIRIPGIPPATDLVERQFRPDSPNVLRVADLTYLRTGEGWLHLAAVQDTYSRQIVGRSMATHTRATPGHRRASTCARTPTPRARADPPLRPRLRST